jgi:hypothetical protein
MRVGGGSDGVSVAGVRAGDAVTEVALNAESYEKFLESDTWARWAGSVASRFGSKVPIIGAAITTASIGYDIHEGEPAGKAIVSGVGGALAAAGTGALIGTPIGGPVGTLVGAGAGVIVGVAASSRRSTSSVTTPRPHPIRRIHRSDGVSANSAIRKPPEAPRHSPIGSPQASRRSGKPHRPVTHRWNCSAARCR